MNLEVAKSAIAALALLLAFSQAVGMAQVQGSVRLLPVGKRTLRRIHRGGGITTLVLMALVAAACVFGKGLRFRPLRVAIHAAAGSLAMVVLLAKVVITHRARHLLRFNKILGGIAGILILVTFAASVIWYYL